MQKITPFLWFNNQAEEAVNYYLSIFLDGKITSITRNGETGPGIKGSVLVVSFQILGQKFIALNGGSQDKFNLATSFVINCENQNEVDHYWEKLSAGGKKLDCGWLTDKYGLAWQVTPIILGKYLSDKDRVKASRVMQAMLKMQKIDIKTLQEAYND